MLWSENEGLQRQSRLGERDLECTMVHMKATAVLVHSSLKNCQSVFKYEMQAPSSGHHGKMKIKGLVATPADSSKSKPLGDPWSLSREMWEGVHLRFPVTKSSVSASGCICQLSPRRGSNNQDYVQRKGNVEPTVRRSHLFSSLLAFTKLRDQCRRLSQMLLTGQEAPNPKSCRAGQELPLDSEAHSTVSGFPYKQG